MLRTPNYNIMDNTTDHFNDQVNVRQGDDWDWRSIMEMNNDQVRLLLLRLRVVYRYKSYMLLYFVLIQVIHTIGSHEFCRKQRPIDDN